MTTTKIKYMGTAHTRSFEKGENWNNRLATPLTEDVVFSLADNGHVVDVVEAGLSQEAVELMLEDENIVDVSDYSKLPTGQAEELWHATKPDQGTKKGEADPPAPDANPDAVGEDTGTGGDGSPEAPTPSTRRGRNP